MEENKMQKVEKNDKVQNKDEKKVKLDKKTMIILIAIIVGAIIIATLGMIDSIKNIIEVHKNPTAYFNQKTTQSAYDIYTQIQK